MGFWSSRPSSSATPHTRPHLAMIFSWEPRLRRPAAKPFRSLCLLTALVVWAKATSAAAPVPAVEVVGSVDVAPAWAGHPVGFALLTLSDRQYVAFYAADRHLTVASRPRDGETWQLFRLPSQQPGPPRYGAAEASAVVGWDSHNSIVMAADSEGQLHLAGNMHCNRLTYWRTRQPGAIDTFEPVAAMVGRDEEQCTYPVFMKLADGRLVFQYRSGRSGDGSTFLNVYDLEARSWRRLVDSPVFDGEKKRNAYPLPPVAGPDGEFHMSWVWRESPDAAANHDLSYARSRDLAHWLTASDSPITLPITLSTSGVIVDRIPVGGGLLNGSGRVGFDSQKRPLLSYFKYDPSGHSQAFVARRAGTVWKVVQLSDWPHRFELAGGGTLPRYDIRLGAVEPGEEGELRLEFGHVKEGSGVWVLDEERLAVLRTEPVVHHYPRSLWKLGSTFPGMGVRYADDLGSAGVPGRRFFLRWETLPANRDKPRPEPWPEPSMLRVVEVRDPAAAASLQPPQ
jgi:hypothetical protein